MRKSTKAALLSGLVFPGLGQVILKRYLRASVLIGVSLIAVWVIVSTSVEQAMTVVDRIESGEVPLTSEAITEAVSASGDTPDGTLGTWSLVVLGAAWLFAIGDALYADSAASRSA